MHEFTKGDRVRLVKRLHKTYPKMRQGTVARVGKYNQQVYILWHGRGSMDAWPARVLVKLRGSCESHEPHCFIAWSASLS